MGVRQGDVVLVLLPNSIYYPIVFLGIASLGAIATTMNPLSSTPEIKKRITDCNASLAFSAAEKVDTLQALGVPAIGVPDNVNLDRKKTSFSAFYKLISGDFDLPPKPVIKQQDTVALIYSSGTTGVSKGAMLTHGNFIAMVELFIRFEASLYPYEAVDNVHLAVLPMFHIYGLALFVLGLFSVGSSIVVVKKFDLNEVMKAIDRYKVTHFPLVPPILTALTKKAKDSGGSSFKSLKQVSCGAAPLSSIKVVEDLKQALPHVDFIQVRSPKFENDL